MSDKNNAVENYIGNVIQKSWTWERMTQQERERFMDLAFWNIKGNAKQRQEWTLSVYIAFLAGCGYDSFNWREPARLVQPF